jgi:hypothetical protein
MTRKLSILVAAVAAALFAASAILGAATHTRAAFVDGVWVDGSVHALSTGPPPSNAKHPIPLYVIAPVSATHPLHPLPFAKPLGFGAHDHVADVPDPQAGYHGTCDLSLVVPGPKAKLGSNVQARRTLTPAGTKPLLYEVRFDGKLTPLTWGARSKHAQTLGLAAVVNTNTIIGCSISAAPKH